MSSLYLAQVEAIIIKIVKVVCTLPAKKSSDLLYSYLNLCTLERLVAIKSFHSQFNIHDTEAYFSDNHLVHVILEGIKDALLDWWP